MWDLISQIADWFEMDIRPSERSSLGILLEIWERYFPTGVIELDRWKGETKNIAWGSGSSCT